MILLLFSCVSVHGQEDSTGVAPSSQEAVYQRPFITRALGTSIGGYLEGNSNYFSEDGVTEGLSLELRRFNIFLYSSIAPRIKFLAELEFEHGTEEIALETAQVDVELFRELTLRGGVILVPLGLFNQNHDSPKWDIVDRPLVSTMIIPSTFSEVGAGFHGKRPLGSGLSFSYAAFITNGLSDNVILNAEGRTFLPSGKGENLFKEDNNGLPAYSGRVAMRHSVGELGVSFYTGVYNSFRVEGETVDEKRNLTTFAFDLALSYEDFALRGEAAFNSIDVPTNITEIYGNRQWGFFADVSYRILTGTVWMFPDARLNAVVRGEFIDFNRGTFLFDGSAILDDITGLTVGLGFRPAENFVFKANYIRRWTRDAVGTPTVETAGLQFGFAAYF